MENGKHSGEYSNCVFAILISSREAEPQNLVV